jgi:hypothetical protein
MVKINVNDSGECRVTVRGPWDTVKKNLEVAANKVREMARDSRQFASITEGTYIPPMHPPKQPPMQRREETSERFLPTQPAQDYRQARQPQVNRPAPAERPAGGAA